jgi:hypothetical protein
MLVCSHLVSNVSVVSVCLRPGLSPLLEKVQRKFRVHFAIRFLDRSNKIATKTCGMLLDVCDDKQCLMYMSECHKRFLDSLEDVHNDPKLI